MIHTTFVKRQLASKNRFAPKFVRPLACSPGLLRDILLVDYNFKLLILYIGSFDKFHTSAFNALVPFVVRPSLVCPPRRSFVCPDLFFSYPHD